MSYIALYRKWRPLVFEDVVEQEYVVKTLKHSVETGRIAHAYLFCGTRGTGKTTMAKIFSRAINCLRPNGGDPCNECEICRGVLSGSILDVVEIDAASNNSVDNVREIRDEVVYAPSQAKYKVYIIDEVHMLSAGAFNALLKTLEEPPEHVVFILATTEPHKLPATILSRCQRFDFKRISVESIITRLERIAAANNVTVQKDALRLVAKLADGALRDAISILDQCISIGRKDITYNDVLGVVGIVTDTFICEIVDAVTAKDISTIFEYVDRLVADGKDIAHFVSDLVYYLRNLLICKMTDKPAEVLDVSSEAVDVMKRQCSRLERDELISMIKELSAIESGLKWATHPRILLEVTLVRLCESNYSSDNSSFESRLAALERKIGNAEFTSKPIEKAPENTNRIPKTEAPKVNPAAKTAAAGAKASADDSKASGNAGTGMKEFDGWEAVLGELKGSGRMAIYTNLIGTKAYILDEKLVGIVFAAGSGFQKMLVSKAENAEVVEALVGKKLGREIRVKCLDEAELKERKFEEKDEFMEKVQDIARKLNTPLNVIDE